MKPESDLLKAARCFAFDMTDRNCSDVVGAIRGVYIFAGEVHRLNLAIQAIDAKVSENIAQEAARDILDAADDGPEVAILSCDSNS
jgi:hypothetical protein